MRIIAWGNPSTLNIPHRIFRPMEALAARGHDTRIVLEEEATVRLQQLRGADLLLVHRFHGRRALELVRTVGAGGSAIVWDTDDDLTLNLPDSSVGNSRQSLVSQRATQRVAAMARSADVVTTPSEVLAQTLEDTGAPEVHLVENYLPERFVVRTRPSSDHLVIGSVAADDHVFDFRELRLAEVLSGVLDRHAHVRVVSVGADLGLRSPRYDHVDYVPYDALPREMARFDIGIAPLVDVRFNQCRANSKLKEYAAAGVPWLASPVGPYRQLGEKQGGRLVADDEWQQALEQLVTGTRERRRLGKRAQRWGKGETIGKNAKVWDRVVHVALDRVRHRSDA